MDEYAKELLRKNLEVSQESLKILKKMHRARIWGTLFKVVKFIVIVALSYGAYYYIEPYLRGVVDMLSNISHGAGQIKQAGGALNPSGVTPGLLDKLKSLLP